MQLFNNVLQVSDNVLQLLDNVLQVFDGDEIEWTIIAITMLATLAPKLQKVKNKKKLPTARRYSDCLLSSNCNTPADMSGLLMLNEFEGHPCSEAADQSNQFLTSSLPPVPPLPHPHPSLLRMRPAACNCFFASASCNASVARSTALEFTRSDMRFLRSCRSM